MKKEYVVGMLCVFLLVPLSSRAIINGDFTDGNLGWSDYADPNSSVKYYSLLGYCWILGYRYETAVIWQEETNFDSGETWRATFTIKNISTGLGSIITIGWSDITGEYSTYYKEITDEGTYTVDCNNPAYRYVSVQADGGSVNNAIVEVDEVATSELGPTPTPTPTPTPSDNYDFEGDADGWIFISPHISSADASYTGATSAFDGHMIGILTDNATSRFGYWHAPAANPVVAGKLYQFTWAINTTQATAEDVPTMRFRINSGTYSYAMEMIVESAGSSPPYMPPTVGTKDYIQYVMPLDSSSLLPVLDVYDFSTDSGTIYLDQLDIATLDVPSTGWTAESVADFGSWIVDTSIPPYHNVTSGTSGGLQFTSSVSEVFAFGFWTSPADITFTDNQLYRALFTIQSSDSSPPNGAMRVAAADNQVSYRLKYYLAEKPSASGTTYPVYFETHDYVPAANTFNLNFEVMDFEGTQGGTITLTDVDVERHNLLP